ncbi:HrpE/YscL family type III secretion apparatus protein [Sansalvadorimonas verongulae]|uniref:HrpE/YscL family type III secretion apparatus protein n=1 Tax=Sansalvadorimonas verongulae TaxID=2172824 RepID=UPI0012BC1759|nr:HrpE/YscL family type III secretion apparatus protein [Sansalvadorimonas verongulae]MTI14158.1 HrpE/YscL family type III secretion apparatus protein [Sansalvadorimonas verongulae]
MSLNIITITKRDFSLQPGQKVIRAADYSVVERSTTLIDKARERAAQIEAEARQAYQQEKQRGYQDGLLQSRMEQSEQMLKMVDRSINYLSDVEASLADILMTAVKKIIDDYDNRALTVGLIKSGLQHVRNERQVSVRVPPAHFSYVKEKIAEILSGYKGIGILVPVSDPRLKAGSCILESKIGVIDASIDIQLEALRKRFSELTAHSMDDAMNGEREWANAVDEKAVVEGSVQSEVKPESTSEASEQCPDSDHDTTYFT